MTWIKIGALGVGASLLANKLSSSSEKRKQNEAARQSPGPSPWDYQPTEYNERTYPQNKSYYQGPPPPAYGQPQHRNYDAKN